MTMDYCIPHMLFFKCLILTESYKTLEGVMCGTSLPYQPKNLAARQIARQISTSSKFKVPNGELRRCTRLPNISFVRSWIRRKCGKKWNVRLPLQCGCCFLYFYNDIVENYPGLHALYVNRKFKFERFEFGQFQDFDKSPHYTVFQC